MNPKEQAIELRKRGASIRDIEKRLHIARSTLSYWFRDIILPKKHQRRLKRRWEMALVNARKKAVYWHNQQKELRLQTALQEAEATLKNIEMKDPAILDLALAMLYLGEGSKKNNNGTSMGNSNPDILRFFLSVLEKNYYLNRSSLKCELHLRADQNPIKMIRYWSEQLQIPPKNFRKPILDPRTKGKPTYTEYKGVCVIQCGNIAIQRKLVYLSNLYCKEITI